MSKNYRVPPEKQANSDINTKPVIELPMPVIVDENAHLSEFLPSSRLTPSQRRGQMKIFRALYESNATLSNGRKVDSLARSAQWIMERMDESL